MELAKPTPEILVHPLEAPAEVLTVLPQVAAQRLTLTEEHQLVIAKKAHENIAPEIIVKVAEQLPEETSETDAPAKAERRKAVSVVTVSAPETRVVPEKSVPEIEHQLPGEALLREQPSVSEVVPDEDEPSMPADPGGPAAEIAHPEVSEALHFESESGSEAAETELAQTYESEQEMRHLHLQEDEITAEEAKLTPTETFEAIITELLITSEQNTELFDIEFPTAEQQAEFAHSASTVQLLEDIRESMAELTPEAIESVAPALNEMVEIIRYVQMAVAEEADEMTVEAAILRLTDVCEAFLDTLNIEYEEEDVRNLVAMLLAVDLPTEERVQSLSKISVDSGTHERKHQMFQIAALNVQGMSMHRVLGMVVLSRSLVATKMRAIAA